MPPPRFHSSMQNSEWLDPSLPKRLGPFGPCAEGHVAMKPRKGDALLFYSLGPNGKQDRKSLHTGCPVIKARWPSMAAPLSFLLFARIATLNLCPCCHALCAAMAATFSASAAMDAVAAPACVPCL
jgi:hypothetical protein